MANKPAKRPVTGSGGRVTPPSTPSKTGAAPPTKAAARKAAANKDHASKEQVRAASRSGNPRKAAAVTPASSRYTAPLPRSAKVSPRWVPVVMFGLLGLGMLVIFFNYIGFPFGDASNWRLIIGLALILGGIITATQYH